jgi:hypothetical protein
MHESVRGRERSHTPGCRGRARKHKQSVSGQGLQGKPVQFSVDAGQEPEKCGMQGSHV